MSVQRPLKVLLLTSSYPVSTEDHASGFLRNMAEHLGRQDIHVHVLAPAEGRGRTNVENTVTVHRFQYFPLGWQRLAYGSGILPNLANNPWLWFQVPFFLLSMTWVLMRVIRKEQPDLIHAHWILPQGVIAVLAKYLCKVPIVATAHGADTFALQGKLTNWLKRFVVANSDAWTSNTRATANAIEGIARLPSPHVIPMGVDVKLFSSGAPTRLRRELSESALLVLFVGRLIEKKGCHDLLEAFSLLPSELQARVHLWIVGDGEERSKLIAYAKDLGIGDRIRFWGSVANDRLPEFYAAADLFVAPSVEASSSDTEGQGVVLLEAFAARTCVLATSVGGIQEVVTDGLTGVLVEPRNPEKLSAAMIRLLGNEPLRRRLAETAFRQVKEYGWEKIAEKFAALYRTLCESRQDPPRFAK